MYGLTCDPGIEVAERHFTLEDYEGGVPRWCPSCGDHTVLSAVLRICRDEQVPPERVVAVSGIGCSSRFPHYMHAYGFHGLHGRALPVACGIKSRRPDLDVWVATGDGDCCSIGAGHWLHAARYNMDLVVMVFDNSVYGLTKKQTSPTTPRERQRRIAATSTGFLYYVSVAGITGERTELPSDLVDNVGWLRSQTPLPICIGFGISRPEHVKLLAPVADGLIVGSAIVRRIATAADRPRDAVLAEVGTYVSELLAAL